MNRPVVEAAPAKPAGAPVIPPYHALYSLDQPEVGLHGYIAFHRNSRPVAIGGCRCVPYPDAAAARVDALRLAAGMGFKAALAEVDCDGAKAVLMRPAQMDEAAFFQAFGGWVEQFSGRFLTGEDAGTTPELMDWVGRATRHVITSHDGDPSPFTAVGVLAGIEAALQHRDGRGDVDGLAVAIQGVGKVGYHLARLLHERGARLIVADPVEMSVQRCRDEFGASAVPCDDVLRVPCDVLAPCALGAVLNPATIPHLQAGIVAGSANNQLASAADGALLRDRGILYAPDYVINAGGLIWIDEVRSHHNRDAASIAGRVRRIGERLTDLFDRAAAQGSPTNGIADALAAARLPPQK